MRDAVRDLHVQALVNSRSEFPAVTDLRNDEVFGCLMEAADPAMQAHVRELQLSGPVPDAEVECHQAFAMADVSHGIRPSSNPPLSISSITPNPVRNFSDSAHHGAR